MLAMCNKDGIVEASVPGLADMARVSVDACRASLVKLQSPDPDSRTKDHEGRRVSPTDGGWFILNHAKYRAKMNNDERREYFRVKQAEHRANVNTVSNNVKDCQHGQHNQTHKQKQKAKSKESPSSSVGVACRIPSLEEITNYIEEFCPKVLKNRPDIYEQTDWTTVKHPFKYLDGLENRMEH